MSPILFLLFFTAIFSQNLPVYSKKTISDVLYSDSKFSEVVKTLQRTMLLPYLNRLETATLFAPTNQAFKDDPYVTQERMLYHILQREIKAEEFRDGQLLTTHMKLEGKLGPGKIGQKVRVDFVADDDFEEKNDTQVYVGHGKIVEFDLEADNGIIHVIDKVLYTPNDIFSTISSVDQLHTFANYLSAIGMDEDLLRGNHTTIFAPTDDAINSLLKFHERQYLIGECGGGLGDLSLLLNHHLNNTNVLYSESFGVGITNVSTVQGEPIKVEKDEQGHMHVANGTVPLKDVLAENGVIHVFNNISVPNELRFTTLKYLCGLRATKFIKAMESYGLQHYIKDSSKSYTILAPRDEFFDDGLIASFGLNTLKYHVIEGKYLPSDLYHDMHIKTELRTEDLRDQRQRATVSIIQRWYVDGDGDGDGDDNETQRTELRFNDAVVLDQPVEIGNSIIYILSKTLKPPPSIMTVLGNDGQLSSINLFISISNMIPKVRSAKGSTMFAPSKEAVKQLGLIASYFLHPDAREDLRSVVSYHLMNDTIYSDEIPTGESTHYTLGGEPIKVTKTKDDIFVGDADDTSKISKKDVLTSTGVLHVIDKILMPPTLQITVAKLLKGMNANSFLRIVEAAKLTELVQNPEKPFTIFVPTENAFRKINVSRLIMDDEVAGRWARMHIIPSTMGELEDGTEVPTLLSDDVKLVIKRDYILGGYYVEIKGVLFTHARLLSGGKTWNGGAVYEIDKVLLPDRGSGSIGTMFLTVIVSLLLSGFTLIGCIGCVHFWQVWKRRRGYREIPS